MAVPPVSDDVKQEIASLRRSGLSFRQIAKTLDVAQTTARKYGGSTNEPPRLYDLEKIEELAERCPGCGRKVVPPCLPCRDEKARNTN